MNRAGAYPRTAARIQRDLFFRTHLRVFVIAWVGYILLAAFGLLFGGEDLRPYFVGGVVVGFVWLNASILGFDPAARRLRDAADAENWTSRALRRLGEGWTVIDHVEFQDGDIDHVAISSRGVLAVETKWTTRAAGRRANSSLKVVLDKGRADAERSARRLKLFLASKGLSTSVTPVLVVWGPGTAEHLPTDDGGAVYVLAGARREAWGSLGADFSASVDDDSVRAIDALLLSYIESHRPYELRPEMKLHFGRRARET